MVQSISCVHVCVAVGCFCGASMVHLPLSTKHRSGQFVFVNFWTVVIIPSSDLI
jgi:hypothetical protein